MKKILLFLVVACLLTGCANNYVTDGKEYKPYGLLNQDDRKDPGIEYEPCWGNIIWGAILFQTIIAPIYFFGFSLFEPVGKKEAPNVR